MKSFYGVQFKYYPWNEPATEFKVLTESMEILKGIIDEFLIKEKKSVEKSLYYSVATGELVWFLDNPSRYHHSDKVHKIRSTKDIRDKIINAHLKIYYVYESVGEYLV